MATGVFDRIKFCEQLLKRTSQGTFLPSLVQSGPAALEEMFKEIADDAGELKRVGVLPNSGDMHSVEGRMAFSHLLSWGLVMLWLLAQLI